VTLILRDPLEIMEKDMSQTPVAGLSFETVLYEKRGGFAYITMNRPRVLNALNRRALADLREAFQDAKDDPEIRGVIITGAGEKAFIAGADINEVATDTPVEAEQKTRDGQAVMDLIESLGKPTIAAVNGFALGGGCETALACTIRIASENARFGLPEVKLGIIPGYGGTQRLPRLVGKGRALLMILTGEMINAQEAYRIGLVNEVVPTPELVGRAEAVLKQMAANAPLSLKYALQAVNKGLETSLSEGLLIESSLVAICTSTGDKKEGTTAFLEKRAANFKGR
jgi:enoyl-CoA hydratase/carnithine racemase